MVAFTLAIELFLMTSIGVFVQKMKIVQEDFAGQLTNFLIKIVIPCMVLHSVVDAPAFSAQSLSKYLFIMALATAVTFVCLGLGQLVYVVLGKTGSGRVYRYGLTFCHFSHLGIPVVDKLFGATGTLYYVFFVIPIRILYYCLSENLMTPPESRKKKSRADSFKEIFLNPCLVAVLIGLALWITGWEIPSFLDYCITSLGSTCSPLGLTLCGLILGRYDLRKLISLKNIRLPLIRTVAMPAVFLSLTRILLLAGLDPLLCNLVVIYSALPLPSLTPAFTVQCEPNTEVQFEAAGATIIATLLSTVTIPAWYIILSAPFVQLSGKY